MLGIQRSIEISKSWMVVELEIAVVGAGGWRCEDWGISWLHWLSLRTLVVLGGIADGTARR